MKTFSGNGDDVPRFGLFTPEKRATGVHRKEAGAPQTRSGRVDEKKDNDPAGNRSLAVQVETLNFMIYFKTFQNCPHDNEQMDSSSYREEIGYHSRLGSSPVTTNRKTRYAVFVVLLNLPRKMLEYYFHRPRPPPPILIRTRCS